MMKFKLNEFNKRVNACIKETGSDIILKELDWSNLSEWNDDELNSACDAFGEVRDCILSSLRSLDNDEFAKWIREETQPLRDEADKLVRRIIRYWGRIEDPFDVVITLTILGQILSEFSSIPTEEFWDPDIAPKLLMILQANLLRETVEKAQLRLLLDVLSLANSTLGLDANWSVSTLVLVLEEILIKRKLDDMNVKRKDREGFDSLCKKLVSGIENGGSRPGLDVLLSSGHRKIRNNILHEGWKPSAEETERLVAHVVRLSRDLQVNHSSPMKD